MAHHLSRGVAQLVERGIWDAEVAGSNPVTPTNIWMVVIIGSRPALKAGGAKALQGSSP